MDSKKITSIYAITNNKIDSLRAFINLSKEMYYSQKNDLNNNDFLEWLKLSCFQIDEKIVDTIEYYQYNVASIKTIEKAKDKCKDLSILLNKYKLELLNSGFDANEYSIYKKERKDAFDFELDKQKKVLIENHLEIKKEFLDIIKFEEPQQVNNLEKPKEIVFKNNFDKVKESIIIEYFKTKLVEKNHISETELNEFLSLAFDKKTLPKQKFSFEKLNTQNDIVHIFYNYYKTTAGKPYGKQKEYLNLLCNYFNGFENFNIKNFSK